MSESIELQVNLNTLVRDGWTVEMETGLRGGQIRSWVKLRHFERGLSFKVRAAPLELKAALVVAMRDAGIEPFWQGVAHEKEATPSSYCPHTNDHKHKSYDDQPGCYYCGAELRAAVEPTSARPPCKGKNCGSTDPRFHSAECFEEYDRSSGATVPPSATPPSREQFEAWARSLIGSHLSHDLHFRTRDGSTYSHPTALVMWWAWCASKSEQRGDPGKDRYYFCEHMTYPQRTPCRVCSAETKEAGPDSLNEAWRNSKVLEWPDLGSASEPKAGAQSMSEQPTSKEQVLEDAYAVLAAAHDRIHGLPRTSDTALAMRISNVRAAIEKVRGAVEPTSARPPCKGKNCGSTDPRFHSAECFEEYDRSSGATVPPSAVHTDDIAVDRFAAAMKAKLAKKRAEGRTGWDDPEQCTIDHLHSLLVDHVPKGDMVDVGNFAMMIFNRFKSWDDAASETKSEVSWTPYGNDGMRHTESADLSGGATDEAAAPLSDEDGPGEEDGPWAEGWEERSSRRARKGDSST